MRRDLRLYLVDIVEAGDAILSYTQGKTEQEYEESSMLRAAVERKFIIIGEALNQALESYPQLRGKIDEDRDIVAFRNRVVHGYFSIDDNLIWSATKVGLPELLNEVRLLLQDEDL